VLTFPPFHSASYLISFPPPPFSMKHCLMPPYFPPSVKLSPNLSTTREHNLGVKNSFSILPAPPAAGALLNLLFFLFPLFAATPLVPFFSRWRSCLSHEPFLNIPNEKIPAPPTHQVFRHTFLSFLTLPARQLLLRFSPLPSLPNAVRIPATSSVNRSLTIPCRHHVFQSPVLDHYVVVFFFPPFQFWPPINSVLFLLSTCSSDRFDDTLFFCSAAIERPFSWSSYVAFSLVEIFPPQGITRWYALFSVKIGIVRR